MYRRLADVTDVVYLAKVQISKQITTSTKSSNRCCVDVVYLAKVQISKQITTDEAKGIYGNKMLFTLQRYKFLSKSQPLSMRGRTRKDVVYLAKVQISKQITTVFRVGVGFPLMLFTLQRYKFLSKSQPATSIGRHGK